MGIFLIFSLGQTKDPIKGLVELRLDNYNDCVRSLRVRTSNFYVTTNGWDGENRTIVGNFMNTVYLFT